MDDYYSGLDLSSFKVFANCTLDGVAAGQNLAPRFRRKEDGVWEWKLTRPITALNQGRLMVSVADRQGNVSRVDRIFSVGKAPGPR